MAKHHRQRPDVCTGDHREIRAAEIGSSYLDKDLTGSGIGQLEFDDLEWAGFGVGSGKASLAELCTAERDHSSRAGWRLRLIRSSLANGAQRTETVGFGAADLSW